MAGGASVSLPFSPGVSGGAEGWGVEAADWDLQAGTSKSTNGAGSGGWGPWVVNEFPFRLDSQDVGSAPHTHMGRVAFCSQHARQSKGCYHVLCAQNLVPFCALHPFQAMASPFSYQVTQLICYSRVYLNMNLIKCTFDVNWMCPVVM